MSLTSARTGAPAARVLRLGCNAAANGNAAATATAPPTAEVAPASQRRREKSEELEESLSLIVNRHSRDQVANQTPRIGRQSKEKTRPSENSPLAPAFENQSLLRMTIG